MNTYTTATEAVQREILDALPANADIAFNIDAIADAALTTTGEGTAYRYHLREDLDTNEFWAIVENNAYTYTARLTAINDETEEGTFDTVTIYQDGEEFDTVLVESTEQQEPYDEAVREVLADVHYEWENDQF